MIMMIVRSKVGHFIVNSQSQLELLILIHSGRSCTSKSPFETTKFLASAVVFENVTER